MIEVDRWREITHTLVQHKLRTVLTAFGVFWGIFMLVILLGATRGLEAGATQNFSGKKNTVYLWTTGRTQLPYRGFRAGRSMRLTDRERDAVLQIPELALFSAVNNLGGWQTNQYVVYQDKSGSFNTRGVEPDQMLLDSYGLLTGRMINEFDYEQRRKVVFIGSGVSDILFGVNSDPVGQALKIGGIYFQVIGVFEPLNTLDEQMSTRVVMPLSTLRKAYNQTWYGHFQFSPKPGYSAIDLEKKVRLVLKEINHVHPDDNGGFGSFNMEREYQKVQSLFQGIKTFSWIIAIGTIFSGVVGVGNIMLIVVKERTREIGLRKALGATSANVVFMILQETLVLTTVAGYFGLSLGVFLLEGVTTLLNSGDAAGMFKTVEFDFASALMALLVLIVAGAIAAILPASKAARVNPIIALQDE